MYTNNFFTFMYKALLKQLNPKYTKTNFPLAQYTTLKIGGIADIVYESHDTKDLINVAKISKYQNVPFTILGRGSNVLISDDGIRGLVIINYTDKIVISGDKPVTESKVKIAPRLETDSTKGTFKYNFNDLDYDEFDKPRVEVTMDSGVDLPFAIKYLLDKGITGMQWFSGIPGTIGGAVFNNIHGGTHFISEILDSLEILDNNLKIKKLSIKDLKLDYDKSRFHNSNEIILKATFNLFKGDANRAKFVALEWLNRKKIQPRNSAGCTFANITQEQKEQKGYPTTSVGYIIEHELKMSGFRIGDAAISKDHHNFIVNEGKALAKDYLAVMKEIYKQAKDKLDIELTPEIVLLGFKNEEIKEFIKDKGNKLIKY